MDARVTISLVTWNSARFLEPCLNSLRAQQGVAWTLLVFDNASLDDSVACIRERLPQATIIRSPSNIGFSRGHNRLILLSGTPYVLVLNPDTILEPTALARLVAAADADARRAAVGPKLLRWSWRNAEDPLSIERTRTLDSAGIERMRTGAFLERGANAADAGQFDAPEEVFAASGACLLLRRTALTDVQIGLELLDEDFFAYKEDVDVAWRLRQRGWKIWYEPRAVVYHYRQLATPAQRLDPVAVRTDRQRRGRRIRRLSYRNHWLTYFKNGTWREAWRAYPLRPVYELAKTAFLLVTEPRTLTGLWQALRLVPRMRAKRRAAKRIWNSPSSS